MSPRHFYWLALVFALTTTWLLAQVPDERSQAQTRLRILVSYETGRPAHRMLRVQLLTPTEGTFGEGYTNDEGWVEFSNVPQGSYRLRISGFGVVETTTGSLSVQEGSVLQVEMVQVNTSEKPPHGATGSAPMVAAADFGIPGNAVKEYSKGTEALRAGKLGEARSRLEKAIALYPQYAMAHNDLGVALMSAGEHDKGRAAFEKAIQMNPSYARPYRNLAMLLLQVKSHEEAGRMLEKSLALEPLDPQGLTLFARLQFLTGKMEEAVATARKVHSVPHGGFAAAHLVAAQALESRQLEEEAAAEYRTFLQEAPNSPSASQARASLKKLTAN